MTLPNNTHPTFSPTWRGAGWILGHAALLALTYPVKGGRKNDTTGEEVEFDILEPVEIPGPLGTKTLRQEVQLRISASRTRIHDVAEATLSEIADMIAFASGRRVHRHLGAFTNAPPDVTIGDYRTIMPMTRVRTASTLVSVAPDFLWHVAANIDDLDSDRGRRLTRALRWLRRSYAGVDEISEFTSLAFAYEALTGLLPEPPRPKSTHATGGRKSTSAAEKSGSTEKLQFWAVNHAHIQPEDWKHVGRLRHSLFHGGLTEDAETLAAASNAAPFLHLALTSALKKLLGLPPEAPPAVAIPSAVNFRSLELPGVVLTKPPESEMN